jgi:hypothetical protein
LKLLTYLCRVNVEVVYIPSELEITLSKEQPGGSDLDDIKTILIVEDDEQIGELLERTIAEETPYKPWWSLMALRP